jgi:hypothetical protein
MNEATRPIFHNDAADTEVELSAEDLLALSHSHSTKPEAVPLSVQFASAPTLSTRKREVSAPGVRTSRHQVGARVALSLVGAFVLVSAGYGLVAWRKATPSLAATFEPKTSLAQTEAEPMRFKNPFDPKEVFEFSPGTTEDAAREAVAEVLMKRALARQGS